ncbi:hypothetical protein [Muricoccus nepalensis]|nr:hypothetical protein [Roseomonas nepalensis]
MPARRNGLSGAPRLRSEVLATGHSGYAQAKRRDGGARRHRAQAMLAAFRESRRENIATLPRPA